MLCLLCLLCLMCLLCLLCLQSMRDELVEELVTRVNALEQVRSLLFARCAVISNERNNPVLSPLFGVFQW